MFKILKHTSLRNHLKNISVVILSLFFIFSFQNFAYATTATDSYGEAPAGAAGAGGGSPACNGPNDGDQPDCSDAGASAANAPGAGIPNNGGVVVPPKSDKCSAIEGAGGSCDDITSGTTVFRAIDIIVTVLSILLGIIALIFIILAGLKYITSGGNEQKIAEAKKALIYAIIGLGIASLAQMLVNFAYKFALKV